MGASETKRLRFTGYSDDTVACSGPGIDVDFDTCASGEPVWMRVKSGRESLVVVGQYAPGPCAGWLIGIAPDDGADTTDDVPVPAWPIRFEFNDEVVYSPLLVIDAPADAEVTVIDKGGKRLRWMPDDD